MSLFFLLVSLEIRREMSTGALASPRLAVAPALAAAGGAVLPVALYLALTWRDPAARQGWAVPLATDIAFSLAVLRLAGRGVPESLAAFMSALAIIDDLIAIAVIAVAFGHDVAPLPLGAVAVLWVALRWLGPRLPDALGWAAILAGFLGLWLLFRASSLHPTLAGVALAFAVPAAQTARLEWSLGWIVALVVLPLFGLANAGVGLGGRGGGSGGWADPVALGILAGLLVGKPIGVFATTQLAIRLGLVRLAPDIRPIHLLGGAGLCGIGFTMSLFIGDLAFADPALLAQAKRAVFAGSALAALGGLATLALARSRQDQA